MPPMYAWEHRETKAVVEVVRGFEDYEVPPTPDEAKGLSGAWDKIIGGKQTLMKTRSWGGGKGNWAVILGACVFAQLQNWLA